MKVSDKIVNTYAGEALHVAFDNSRVWTLQFLDDVKTLVELREDVRYRTREQRVLRRLLELYTMPHSLILQHLL